MDLTPSAKYDHVFAILRVDGFHKTETPLSDKITVMKVVFTEVRARQEVDRLNSQADGDVEYLWQVTRLEPRDKGVGEK